MVRGELRIQLGSKGEVIVAQPGKKGEERL